MQIWAAEARVAARVGTSDQLYLKLHAANNTIGRLAAAWEKWQSRDASPNTVQEASRIFIDEIPPALGQFFDATAQRIGPDRTAISN